MSFLTNVHADNKRERKLSVIIFNVIIFVMSFFILVAYMTQPFFRVRANAELTKEDLAEVIQLESEDINVAELLEDGVALELEIAIPADIMLETAAKCLNRIIFHFDTNVDVSEYVTELINGGVDSLVDQLLPVIEKVAINAAKQLAITTGKDALLDALTQGNTEQAEMFEQKLEQAGITDAYLEDKMETVTNALQAENATPESVADVVVDVMDTIIADLKNQADTDLHIENFDNVALKDAVVEALEMFTKEDGTIDLDSAIAELFNKALENESNPETTASTTGNTVALLSAAEETEDDSVAELKLNVRNKILGLLDESTYATIGTAMKISSLVLVLSMFAWLYMMIKIIIKSFMKDKTVKFAAPIIFGGLPGLLWLIPSVFMFYLYKHPTILPLPYNLKLAFASSGWLAIMGILVLFILFGPYCALRNSLCGKKLRDFK